MLVKTLEAGWKGRTLTAFWGLQRPWLPGFFLLEESFSLVLYVADTDYNHECCGRLY